MTKQDALKWIQENNNWGEKAPLVIDFEKKLDAAILKQENTATTWLFGKGLIKDGQYHRIQLFAGHFLIDSITEEYAKEQGVEESQIITMERGIKTTKFEKEEKSKISDEVWEYISKAWDSISEAFPGSEDKIPISIEELNNFKMWTNKAQAVENKTEEDNEIIKEAEESISIWEERKYDGPSRDLKILIGIYSFAIIVKIVTFFTGSVSNLEPNTEQSFSFFGTLVGITMLAGTIGYYWAYKAPLWLIYLRDSEPRKNLYNIISRLSKRAYNTNVENTTTYASGKVEKSTDSFTGPMIALALWLFYYYIFLQFIPIFTGIAYLKNYVFYKK